MEETMNKQWKIVVLALSCLGLLNLLTVTPLAADSPKLCCVAGTYQGFQVNKILPNCPRPQKEKFTMEIKQEERCQAAVWGTVIDSSGVVSNWKGTLTRGLRGCCNLVGTITPSSGNTVTFKGSLCQKMGKWHAKGTWVESNSTDPCRGSGTWVMDQV
jgi:hypothetical protein